jgi:hypothetical protein
MEKSDKGRRIVLFSYCKGRGYAVDYMKIMDLCSDPECGSCRRMENAFKEEVNRILRDKGNESK